MAERQPVHSLAASLTGGDASLVDVIDSLVDKGVVLQGDIALGIAGIDLITLKLAALLVSAERLAAPRAPAPDGSASVPGPDETVPLVTREAPLPAGERPRQDVPAAALDAPTQARSDARVLPTPMAAAADDVVAASLEAAATKRVPAGRWDVDPDDVRRSVMKLVLTLVEVIRQLLERRAIRQMEAAHLSDEEVDRLGRSLHELEATVVDLAAQAGLDPADLNLDLGPLGRLL